MLEKQILLHHSVTENGNLQLRIVTEYVKDGKVLDKKYSEAYTPKDIKNMEGFDDRSKDIVATIIPAEIVDAVEAEFWETNGQPEPTELYTEVVTYDRVIEEDGKIAVRKITRIYDEGREVSKKYHRSWIMPGDDLSKNDVISKAIAKKLHTPVNIELFRAAMAKNDEAFETGVKR